MKPSERISQLVKHKPNILAWHNKELERAYELRTQEVIKIIDDKIGYFSGEGNAPIRDALEYVRQKLLTNKE